MVGRCHRPGSGVHRCADQTALVSCPLPCSLLLNLPSWPSAGGPRRGLGARRRVRARAEGAALDLSQGQHRTHPPGEVLDPRKS
jgi:hypothetical protein